MIRVLVSLLLGSLATAAAVIASDHLMGIMFAAGLLACVLGQVVIIILLARKRVLARLLRRMADSIDHRAASSQRTADKRDKGLSKGLRREFRANLKSDSKSNHREASQIRKQWAAAMKIERPVITPRKPVAADDPNFDFLTDSELCA